MPDSHRSTPAFGPNWLREQMKCEEAIAHPAFKVGKPTHYSVYEGGPWHEWGQPNEGEHQFKDYKYRNRYHAIKFESGAIFDMVNGWRPLISDGTVRLPDAMLANHFHMVPDTWPKRFACDSWRSMSMNGRCMNCGHLSDMHI